MRNREDGPQGTLDLLILRILTREPTQAGGSDLARWTENTRPVKHYAITQTGRRQRHAEQARWNTSTRAVARVLERAS